MPMRKLTAYGPSVLVLITAAVVLLAGPSAVHRITFAHTAARIDQASHRLAQDDNILGQINQAYRDIAAAVEPSVVHISAQRPALPIAAGRRGPRMAVSSGSGWVYDEQGHIVTNYHVVEDAARIDVQLQSGQTRSAEIVGFDPSTDIAVLKIAPGLLHPAMRADPLDHVQQGDIVFAFGSPFDFRFSMSSGVVSGKGRYVGVIGQQFGSRNFSYENFIQTDAAINPGNSGGPLTDYRGRVIGMNTAIATASPRRSQDGRVDEGQFGGVGLAIPLDMIEPVVSQLIATGEVQKGYLGVGVVDRANPIARERAAMGFHERGVSVARVDPRASVLHSQLLPGDVLTHVDRVPVDTAEEILSRAVLAEGETLDLSIWRHDADRNRGTRMRLTLDAQTAESLHDVSFLVDDEPIIRRLEKLGYTGHGVPIARVEPRSPAEVSGLRVFDVITHINGQQVATSFQVRSMISSMMPGQSASLRVWRYDAQEDRGGTVEITVELAQLDMLALRGVAPPRSPSPNGTRDDDGDDVQSLEQFGIAKMSTATPERVEALGQSFHPGVLIEEIVPGSALEDALPVGSIIVSAGDRRVLTVDDFLLAIDRAMLSPLGVSIAYRDPDGNFRTARLPRE